MNQQLQVFTNNQFGEIRAIEKDGQPYFVGKDIAERLGYKDTADAIKRHIDEDDKQLLKVGEIPTLKISNYGLTIINESGLYSLILSSKLPTAKQFKHWVTSEVLPSIRKTGGYITTNENDTDEAIMAKALLVAQKTIEGKNKILKQKEMEIKMLEPRASYTDLILQSKALVNVTQIAQDYGMSAVAFNNLLSSHKIQFQQNKQWILYSKYKDKSYVGSETFKFKHKTTGKKDVTMTTKWTQKGRKFLYDFLKDKGIIPVMEMEG